MHPSTEIKLSKCTSCRGLRPLELHLHELSRYCELLGNVRPRSAARTEEEASQTSGTGGIAKWLLLCSQVDKVVMDTSAFEVAQLYCEPVLELQKSDADHRGTLATSLTRFVFFCNALEEAYRFCEPTYDREYDDGLSGLSQNARFRSPSMKAAALLREYVNRIPYPPSDMAHLVENLSRLAHVYEREFAVKLALVVEDPRDIVFGLDIVRCLRNHVAHATFPILENPEYSMDIKPDIHRAMLVLINQAIRVGAIYIQLLLAVDNDGFTSMLYDQFCDDYDTGRYFIDGCTVRYLLSLHRNQDFGLNEAAYLAWRERSMQPSSRD